MKDLVSRLMYPDPMQPIGLELTIKRDAVVTVKIFDLEGEEIESVLDGAMLKTGKHVISLDLRRYEIGDYVYRLTASDGVDSFVESKKISVVR